jgi:hypothetical protein
VCLAVIAVDGTALTWPCSWPSGWYDWKDRTRTQRCRPRRVAFEDFCRMVQKRAMRTSLDPDLASILGRDRNSVVRTFATRDLEEHDPRFAGPISDQIRNSMGSMLFSGWSWQALRNPCLTSLFVTCATHRAPYLACVLSASGNGYLREAAVRRMVVTGPFSLAMLVRRLNDWVPNVRRAAERRLAEVSRKLDPAIVADCMEYLCRFEGLERASNEARTIVSELRRDIGVIACVREKIINNSDDRAVRLLNLAL